ncbi:hypothetical protein MKW92_008210 [Papaver armeniacum]|nr:hypothetical protein MKW92_008210 [Papaver armeniacum]
MDVFSHYTWFFLSTQLGEDIHQTYKSRLSAHDNAWYLVTSQSHGPTPCDLVTSECHGPGRGIWCRLKAVVLVPGIWCPMNPMVLAPGIWCHLNPMVLAPAIWCRLNTMERLLGFSRGLLKQKATTVLPIRVKILVSPDLTT